MSTARGSASGAVSLSEVHESLALLAEAIAGRPIPFEVVEEATCWPFLPGRPGALEVALPAVIGRYQAHGDNRTAYRMLVLHQLIARDDEDEPITFPSGRDRALLRYLFAMVEDVRVNAVTRRLYPGARGDLSRLLAVARAAEGGEAPVGLLELVRLRSLGGSAGQCRDVVMNVDRPQGDRVLAELARVEEADATAALSLEVTERICDLVIDGVTGVVDPSIPTVDDDAPPETAGLVDDDPRGASMDTQGTPSEFEPADAITGGQPASDLSSQSRDASNREPEAPLAGLTLPDRSSRETLPADVRTFVYDEWDYRERQHRSAWCRVVEERLSGDDHDFIADVRSRHFALRSRIRRSFIRLRPRGLVRIHRSADGEELDLDATIEAIADRRSGAPADDRLHTRRDRVSRDVATAFLVDLSASTSSPAVPPEPVTAPADYDPSDDILSYAPIWGTGPDEEQERRVIDVAKDAVALMGDALHELGDQHAIYGFSGSGRNNVEFKIVKDFDDRVSGTTWAALAAMKPRHYTRMGAAVRHASAKLATTSARTKLLIVISDGYPQDTDYGEDRRDRDYGVHDTRRALADAALAHIDTFCVTIDPAGHDYLRVMSPDHRYLVIDDVESLPEELAKLYLTLAARP